MNNQIWAERIIQRFDPSFKQRWEAYDDLITSYMTKESVWIDIGCGQNESVEKFGTRNRISIGVDMIIPESTIIAPFLCADLHHLPFPSDFADLITLRFVVEHLRDISADFEDIGRVLKPGGRVVIITTNTWSPFVIMGKSLPFLMKKRLLQTLYKINDTDVLPTFHHLNTSRKMRYGIGILKLVHLEYIQGASYVNRWLFVVFFLWHLATKLGFLRVLRDNLLAVFRKPNQDKAQCPLKQDGY